MSSTSVEATLGWDNFVNGVRVGLYMLNNAPLLPLAIQEMRREYSDQLSYRDRGGEIADVVQTVLFRHIGRRQELERELNGAGGRFSSCVARGWSIVSSLPISMLAAFGLLNPRHAEAVRESFVFKLWNLILGLAAIVAPTIAYLADHEKVDIAIRALIPW